MKRKVIVPIKIQFLRKTPEDLVYEDKINTFTVALLIAGFIIASLLVIAINQSQERTSCSEKLTSATQNLESCKLESGCLNVNFTVSVVKYNETNLH